MILTNMTKNINQIWEGVTLEDILKYLVSKYGFEELGQEIRINCFTHDPSIKSSLKFLRRTPWARQKVEDLYFHTVMLDRENEERGVIGEN